MKTKNKLIVGFSIVVLLLLVYLVSNQIIYGSISDNLNYSRDNKSIVNAKSNGNIKAIVITVDNYTDNEMNNISKSVKRDYASIVQMFNLMESRNLFTVDKYYLKGNKTSKNDIISTLENIKSNSEDVVFVYFSGHGGMDTHGTFLVSREGDYVYRKEIETILNSTPGKLKLLITDACANDIDGYAITRSFKQSKNSYTGKFDQIYTSLFSNYKGFLNIASSSQGEYSWSDDDMGGYFTYYFFQETMLKNPSNSWKILFETARNKLIQMDNRINNDQRGYEDDYTSQTPVAYSLPVPLGEIIPVQNTELVNGNVNNQFTVTIKNNTNQKIQCFFENDKDVNIGNKYYSEEKIIAPGKSITINNYNLVYFFDGKEQAGCELENGNFVFEDTQRGMIDLFYSENETDDNDSGNNDEYVNSSGFGMEFSNNSSTGYERLLTGEWRLDDGVYYRNIKFNSNSTYEIKSSNNKIIESGKWKIEKETFKNEKYDVLILSKKTNQGVVEEYYDISAKNNSMIELFLVDKYLNDMPDTSVSYENDTIYLLYR